MKSSKNLKIIFTLIIGILVITSIFLKKEKQFIEVSEITNGIGIKTLLINVKNEDVIYVKCVFENSGVLQNNLEKHGISAVVGFLLFNKIGKFSTEETQEKMADLGVCNLIVNPKGDNFEISFCMIRDKAKEALQFLSSAFTNPSFTEGDLENAKEMFPEFLDIELSSSNDLVIDKMLSMLFVNSTYGMSNTGTVNAISGITSKDIHSFIKERITKKNLNVIFTGDISRFDACSYLEYLFGNIPSQYEHFELQKIESISLSNDQVFVINKPGMKDIAEIIVGARGDRLTNIERAAAYIIMKTIFDEKTGDFVSGVRARNIACNINNFSIKRSSSNVFYFSAFLEKRDIAKYQKYLDEKIIQYNSQINLKELQKTQEYFIEASKNGFSDLSDIDEKIYNSSLPFNKVTSKVFEKVIKMIFHKENIKIVICCEE